MKGKNLVETCANVLVTSGYTDYAKNLWKSGPDFFQKITCEIFAVTSRGRLWIYRRWRSIPKPRCDAPMNKYAKQISREQMCFLENFGAKQLGSSAFKSGSGSYRKVEET